MIELRKSRTATRRVSARITLAIDFPFILTKFTDLIKIGHQGSCASICSTPPTSPNSNSISCRGPKTKKIMYNIDENDDFDREMIATYEEVSKLYPRPGIYRPIVLIGAPGVGRNELKRRLVARDPEKYRSPVPCKFLLFLNR